MDEAGSRSPKPSPQELLALNDEIAGLVRAGIPLELGLRELPGHLAQRLADRMSQGMSLDDALSQEKNVPAVYQAVVRAGIRTGRLPEALESLTRFGTALQDVRNRIRLAMIYPLAVFTLAYCLFVAFVAVMVPTLKDTYESLRLPGRWWLNALDALHANVFVWAPLVPLFMLLMYLIWKAGSTRSGDDAQPLSGGLASVPGMGNVVRNFHRANFAEMTALLLEHATPLHQALRIAAAATGDAKVILAADDAANSVEDGNSLTAAVERSGAFPLFMRYMLANGEQQGTLSATLRQVTDVYRRRAESDAEWFKLLFPITLTAIVGGGATLLYGLTVFVPLIDMINSLSRAAMS